MLSPAFHGSGMDGSFRISGPEQSFSTNAKPAKRTAFPMVTGTSVLGIKFEGGVAICADTLGSYGSLARYRDCSRLMKVNDTCILGAGGDYADFQYLKALIEDKINESQCLEDQFDYKPKHIYSWLTRLMYYRRSKFDPIWNVSVVGGMQDQKPFLGYVDKIGIAFEAPTLASGYGAYIAQPLLRQAYEKKSNMTQAEALATLDRCMQVLFYRDARSWNKYEVAIVTKEGTEIKGPISCKTNWEIAPLVTGYE